MRIMLIGSIPDHKFGTNQQILPEHQPLLDAAREIGYAIAMAGHHILVGSTSPRTIDFYAIEGAANFCHKHPDKKINIELHHPQNEPPNISPELKNLQNLHFSSHLHHADPSSPHKWVVAHARAVDEADVVIAMCGATSTRIVGHLATDRRKPLIAIPCFNGAAEELFSSVYYMYNGISINNIPSAALLSEWNSESAQNIVKFAERLVAPNNKPTPCTYFISYSQNDCQIADHIEVLLRREHRLVHRDEINIATGEPLNPAIQALIEESDSFIAIWSSNTARSAWCPQELAFAKKLQHAGKKPKRIILLTLDNEQIPIQFTDCLYRVAATRSDRALAILQIIKNET